MAASPYHEPGWWHRVVNVGWGGAVVIVQVTAPETKFYEVAVIEPPEGFIDSFGGTRITIDDYKEHFILQMGVTGAAGTVVVEDEIDDIWRWDGFLIAAIGDPGSPANVAAGTAAFGYPPNIHLIGQQVAYDTSLGFPQLGDRITHTFPNGAHISYQTGYTALSNGYVQWRNSSGDLYTGVAIRTSDPGGEGTVEDFSGTESWYWYRVTTRPESTAGIIRKSFLANFRAGFTTLAELHDFASALDYPLAWSIRGYPQGTAFTIADGVMTPVGTVATKFSASGSVSGGHSGLIRRFNGAGFTT